MLDMYWGNVVTAQLKVEQEWAYTNMERLVDWEGG